MSSYFKKTGKIFAPRRWGQSSASVETEPQRDRLPENDEARNNDKKSIESSRPPSYQSKITVVEPSNDEDSSSSAEKESPGDKMPLKGKARDSDKESLESSRPPSYHSQITIIAPPDDGESCNAELYCIACRMPHPPSSFHDNIDIKDLDCNRRCIGSDRVLYLCAHAYMTWKQFRRKVVNVFPSCEYPSTPEVLTINYVRESLISPRDAAIRHTFDSICQAWEGPWHVAGKKIPHGDLLFLMQEQNILWYSSWHIPVPEVWCEDIERVVEGRGPADEVPAETAMYTSKTQDADPQSSQGDKSYLVPKASVTLEEEVPVLIRRLMSFEIYLCPHVNFQSQVLRSTLLLLIITKFKHSPHQSNPKCSVCGANFNIYVQEIRRPTR